MLDELVGQVELGVMPQPESQEWLVLLLMGE